MHVCIYILFEYKIQTYIYAWFSETTQNLRTANERKHTCFSEIVWGILNITLHLHVKMTSLWSPLWIKIISLGGCIFFLMKGEFALCLIPWRATDLLDASVSLPVMSQTVTETPTSRTQLPLRVEAPWAFEETSNFEKTKQDIMTENNPRASSQEKRPLSEVGIWVDC